MIYMINHQKKRFYWLMLEQDLFDTWCVKKVYGSIESQRRREVLVPFPDRQAAAMAITNIEHIRRQRGYIHDGDSDLNFLTTLPVKTRKNPRLGLFAAHGENRADKLARQCSFHRISGPNWQ